MPKPIYSTPESLQASHDALTRSLLPTLPPLLHGSGDVEPSAVNPATVALLADMTATYVGKLVDAAVDAHDVLTDGAGGIRPPPNFPRRGGDGDDGTSSSNSSSRKRNGSIATATALGKRRRPADANTGSSTAGSSSKRRRKVPSAWNVGDQGGDYDDRDSKGPPPEPGSVDDTWDTVEVPLPKITRVERAAAAVAAAAKTAIGAATAAAAAADGDSTAVHHSEWVGLTGIDLFAPRRRVPYASPPNAIETKSFIFPICHDATLYGRIMEVQKARRTIVPMLGDPILMDLVQTEGRDVVRAIEAGRRLGEGTSMMVLPGGGGGGAGAGAGAGGGFTGGGTGGAAGANAGSGGASGSDAGGLAAAAASVGESGGGGGGIPVASGAETEKEGGEESAIMSLRNGPADGAVWPGMEDLVPTYKKKMGEEEDDDKKKN